MATKEELDRFDQDQRHILIKDGNLGEAALALQSFDLDVRDRNIVQGVLDDPLKYEWINSMTRDLQGRFLWVHGKGEEGIVLTYLESEWSDRGGSPLPDSSIVKKPSLKP